MKKSLTLLLAPLMALALEVGSVPPLVTLDGDNGGRVDGTDWSSEMLQDKIHVLFYVDPDEKETNSAVADALKAKEFDRGSYASVAIINMAATWLPNFAIASSLEKKQKEFPHTIYVKDLHKTLVKEWKIADDSSNVLKIKKKGRLLFMHEGKLEQEQINTLISLIEERI